MCYKPFPNITKCRKQKHNEQLRKIWLYIFKKRLYTLKRKKSISSKGETPYVYFPLLWICEQRRLLMMCVNQCVSLSLGSNISNVARSYSLCVQREPVLSSPCVSFSHTQKSDAFIFICWQQLYSEGLNVLQSKHYVNCFHESSVIRN